MLAKVAFVNEAVQMLASKQSLSESEYLEDREAQAVVERNFHTAIEACIDIAELFIVASSREMPERNADRFRLLEEMDIVSQETAIAMAEAAGFRHVLAHTYGAAIDDELVYRHLQDDLLWFPTYCREIRSHLDL